MAKRKPKPIEELGGRWIKSKSGRSISYIIKTSQTDWRGVTLYRLRSLLYDWVDGSGKKRNLSPSDMLWTAEELRATGRILKNKPSAAMIREAKEKL